MYIVHSLRIPGPPPPSRYRSDNIIFIFCDYHNPNIVIHILIHITLRFKNEVNINTTLFLLYNRSTREHFIYFVYTPSKLLTFPPEITTKTNDDYDDTV